MQDAPKAVWSNPYVSVAFLSRILLHIVFLKCQIAFFKFTICDNQAWGECIPIAAVNLKL